jgi:phosphoribosylformylglycinamidine cyclo-ligase
MTEHTYKNAGVDRDSAAEVRRRIAPLAAATHGPQVLEGIRGFGAMYRLSGYKDPILVSSTDGVGTKLKIAITLGSYDTLGDDLVNACVNDVVVCGADPLFFLDYIAVGALRPDVVEILVAGMARACEVAGCALIGGETAEMPGMYEGDDFDLAGFAVGAAERSDIADPSSIAEGDLLVGIPSNGLHTNGYSLVRDALAIDDDPTPLAEHHSELDGTLGEALLVPHLSYVGAMRAVRGRIKAAAHITGGGLIENVPRALPDGLGASFDTTTWGLPPVFSILLERTSISREETYRVFNMGLGLVLVCDRKYATEIEALVEGARVVGEVYPATGENRVTL